MPPPADSWDALVETQLGEPGVKEGRMFGWPCLKVERKVYACDSGNGLVLKLPEERVREEIEAGRGEEFAPMQGRVMREWVRIGDPQHWPALTDEARLFATP